MLKTLYVTNVPSPYRVSFLELLGRRTDLTVLYERKTANDRDNRWWTAEDTHHYQEVCLKGLPIRADSSLSRGIVSHLHLHAYDRILLCNYSSPSVMLAIRYLRRLGIPFGIICDGILPKPEEKDGWKLRLKRSLVSAADFWLSSGPVTTEELVRIGAVRDRIFRYPLSSVSESDLREAARCDRASAKRSLGLEGKTVLLYVGRFIPCKGLDVLIHAFAQLKSSHPELALLMVGGTAGELTYDTGGSAESVRALGGIVTRKGDLDAVLQLIQTHAYRPLSEAEYSFAQKQFDCQTTVQAYLSLYR